MSTFFTDLERQLVTAARAENARRRPWRLLRALAWRRPSAGTRSPTPARAAVAVAALSACAVAFLIFSGGTADRTDAGEALGRVGEFPPSYGATPPESRSRYATPPTVLAVSAPGAEPEFSIVGYQIAFGPGDAELCLDIRHPDGTGSGCHSPSEHAQGVELPPSGGLAIGATTQTVERVVIEYTFNQEQRKRTAALARADDRAALARAGAGQPFTFYAAELPHGAEHAVAVALLDGREIWRTAFNPH